MALNFGVTSHASSNLHKFLSATEHVSALETGWLPDIKEFFVHGQYVYINLAGGITTNSFNSCHMGRIDPDGTFQCVGVSLNRMASTMNGFAQIDANEAVYYLAVPFDGPQEYLYKWDNGVRTNLTYTGVSVRNFAVALDGNVYIAGESNGGGSWLRRLTPENELSTVLNSAPGFLSRFPDGNIYFSTADGIARINTETHVVEEALWAGTTEDARYQISLPPTPDLLYQTESTVYGVSGHSVYQYFPEPQVSESSLAGVTSIVITPFNPFGVDFIMLGAGADGLQRILSYDLESSTEDEIPLDTDNLEVYSIAYRSGVDQLIYSALRYSDNTYVMGTYDFESGQTTYSDVSAVFIGYHDY
jgi:hypothetical protein